MFRTLAACALTSAVLSISGAAARADFKVCNETWIDVVHLAYGHKDVARGWIAL